VANDDSWLKNPLEKALIPTEKYDSIMAKIKATRQETVLRCRLNFRSPAKESSLTRRYMSEDDMENMIEKDCLALVVAPDRIAIAATLNTKATARLEKITIFTESGKEINATFESTIKDYGLITAITTEKITDMVAFDTEPIKSYDGLFLPIVEIKIQGEELTCYYTHDRITDFSLGWNKMIYPEMSGVDSFGYDQAPTANSGI
jgi:hypothetical protein